MSSTFRLSEVHEVNNVSVITLRDKGYRVWWEASERPNADDWWAEKDGHEFVARSPLGLLGLVALWEMRGDEWQEKPCESEVLRQLKADALAPFARAKDSI